MSVELAQSAAATLVAQLQARAARQPEQTAYIFLADGEAQEQRLTFSQLDQRARVIATELRRRGLAGRPVLLLYPSGLEAVAAFCGCLYAGALAVLTFPPYPGRPLTVQQATAKDAGAALILTTRQILAYVEPQLPQAPDLQARPWVASDTLTAADAEPPASPAADSLAVLSYTSGSTSAPKGVMLSHHNLVHDLLELAGPFGLVDQDVWVSWAPQHHIAGLMISLVPILLGAQVVLMPAQAFVERPARWLETITRRRATVSFGFNFAFQQCLTRITPEEKAALDLSGWRLALVGGERVDAGLLGQFAEAFAASGFRREALRPAYGLSEASAYGSGLPSAAGLRIFRARRAALEVKRAEQAAPADPAAVLLVGCGLPFEDKRIVIVDPETGEPCPPGTIGEIWLAGPHVAQGYWGQSEDTRQTFQARLAGGEGPFLRTGDLGFLDGGELFITGRIKDLIIINGRNYYAQDFEQTVASCHPALLPGGGAAFAVTEPAGEQLVIVHEVRPDSGPLNVDEVAGAIRAAVAAEQEQPVYAVLLVRAGSLPRTPTGKIQRYKCREQYLASRPPAAST